MQSHIQGGKDIWTQDVLNLGVKPDVMVPLAAERFKELGGTVLDETAASSFTVHPDGVAIGLSDKDKPLTARLLLDCMGHSSPIVRQLR
jgi:lycopene cyclase CruP